MTKKHNLSLVALAMSVALLACALPPASPVQQQDIGTAVVQTLTAIAIQNPSQPPAQATLVFTETATLLPLPTPSPSPTFSPIPFYSPTSAVVLVSVSVPTNCRSGPGKVYDYRGALLVGETTEVFGWEGRGEYWYVRNPDRAGDFCWIWGKYASLTGHPGSLPALTPPPTPTPAPDFSIAGLRLDSCVGWFVSVRVKNTGTITFESISIKVKDLDEDKSVGSPVYDEFAEWTGCVGKAGSEALKSGNTGYVQSNDFSYDPTGHELQVTVTMCTENGGAGMCVNRTKSFEP